tara:strand:+ start:411 stop:674 length:264 start_codon:yes stop_codon:yes gene_type:complete
MALQEGNPEHENRQGSRQHEAVQRTREGAAPTAQASEIRQQQVKSHPECAGHQEQGEEHPSAPACFQAKAEHQQFHDRGEEQNPGFT